MHVIPPVVPSPKVYLSDMHHNLARLGRERHAARINRILNDPSIYPWVRGVSEEPLDLTPVLANSNNVLLMGEHGGVIFTYLQPGLYDAHVQVLPAGRGEWAADMMRAALFWMFTRTNCMEVMARCPRGNFASRAIAKAVGGELQFTNPTGWNVDNKSIPADIFSLTIQDWVKVAGGLEERGRWFNKRFAEECRKVAVVGFPENDLPTAERYLGMAAEMFLNGYAQKAVIMYNRWSVMADCSPMELFAINPLPVIKVRNASIIVKDGDFYVSGDTQSETLH